MKVKTPEIGEMVLLFEKLVKALIVQGNRVFGCHVSTPKKNPLRRAFFETDGFAVKIDSNLSVIATLVVGADECDEYHGGLDACHQEYGYHGAEAFGDLCI